MQTVQQVEQKAHIMPLLIAVVPGCASCALVIPVKSRVTNHRAAVATAWETKPPANWRNCRLQYKWHSG